MILDKIWEYNRIQHPSVISISMDKINELPWNFLAYPFQIPSPSFGGSPVRMFSGHIFASMVNLIPI